MRYLVKAKLKPEKKQALLRSIEDETLGRGSVAEGEYLRNMLQARHLEDGRTCWVEICYCPEPLQEERPYWEEYFEILEIKNAHARDRCEDLSGSNPWACSNCDCTERLEAQMNQWGVEFVQTLNRKFPK